MKINYITQIDNFNEININYFICSSGYEERSSYFFRENKQLLEQSKKICFQFEESDLHSKKINDQIYYENNFNFIKISNDSLEEYIYLLNEIFINETLKELYIVIDYSSMTSFIYASILKYFFSYSNTFIEVSLSFTYTQALYTEPPKIIKIENNYPISIFDSIQSTNKRIALIIGLGYEKNKALGLYEYFQNDYEDTFLFIVKKSLNEDFFNKTFENNKEMIKRVNKENIIYYDINDVKPLISSLDSLVTYLISADKRVIIAPTGPKIFTLISLLINLIHNDVTNYRLSHGHNENISDKKPDLNLKPVITLINLLRD